MQSDSPFLQELFSPPGSHDKMQGGERESGVDLKGVVRRGVVQTFKPNHGTTLNTDVPN